MPTDPIELAYLAGIFDGEGTMSIFIGHKPSGYLKATCSIGNTDIGLMEMLRQIAPRVYTIKRALGAQKTMYAWQLQRPLEIIEFLEALLPYLRIKRPKAEEILGFCEERVA